MTVDDFDAVRLPFVPDKTDPPAVIDSNAVLAGPVTPERLEPIAAYGAQIGKAGCRIQPTEPFASLPFNFAKRSTSESFVDRPSFLTSERANHLR